MLKIGKYKKILGDIVIIFLSVVLAFVFEDIRESRSEKAQYKEALQLFGSDLYGDIIDIRYALDSIYVPEVGYIGKSYIEISDLLWIDSLLEQKKATLQHLKYLIDYEYFGIENAEIVIYSNQPELIRQKYSAYASNWVKRRVIPTYIREMTGLIQLQTENNALLTEINRIISQTNPYYHYSESDSLVFYSNEFKWHYKRYTRNKWFEYRYKRYLVNDRFISIAEALLEEAKRINLYIPEIEFCYKVINPIERYECDWGKSPTEVIYVDDLLKDRRKKYE